MSFYEFRVGGRLDGRRSDWFDGLGITTLESAEPMFCGEIVDQAALHGVLNEVRDPNLAPVAARSPCRGGTERIHQQRRLGAYGPVRVAGRRMRW